MQKGSIVQGKYWFNSWSALAISMVFLMTIFGSPRISHSKTINAGFLLKKMNSDQQVSYITGVVEGLAYSRYLREKPSQKGMKCIYSWYAEGDRVKKWKRIDAWFSRHPDKPIGVLLYVLIKKKCGA